MNFISQEKDNKMEQLLFQTIYEMDLYKEESQIEMKMKRGIEERERIWSQIQFNLSDLTRGAYEASNNETQR